MQKVCSLGKAKLTRSVGVTSLDPDNFIIIMVIIFSQEGLKRGY